MPGLFVKHLGHDDAAAVTTDDLRRWRQTLQAEGRAVKTADNYLNDVKTLLRWAVGGGLLTADPTANLRVGSGKKKATDERLPFNDEEARMLLEEARKLKRADRWLPWLLAVTGARIEEVAQATVADIRERDGITYLDVNTEGEGKSLKNVAHEHVGFHPITIAPEDRVPLAERDWKVSPRAPRPHDPKDRLDEAAVVASAASGARRLAQTMRLHLRPLGARQHQPFHPQRESQTRFGENPKSQQTLGVRSRDVV